VRICSPPAQLRSYGIITCQLSVTIQMHSRITSISTGRLLSSVHNLRTRHAKVTRARLTMFTVRESLGKIKLRGAAKFIPQCGTQYMCVVSFIPWLFSRTQQLKLWLKIQGYSKWLSGYNSPAAIPHQIRETTTIWQFHSKVVRTVSRDRVYVYPGTEGTNQNRHWNHHRWHVTNSLEGTRLSCWCL